MRQCRYLALVLIGWAAGPAQANLNEPVETLIKRYGAPTGYSEASEKTPFGTLLYRAGGFELVLFLYQNREVGARVTKLDKTEMTEADLQQILNSDPDSSGTPWTAQPDPDAGTRKWGRADKATALYDREKHCLLFSTEAMEAALQAKPNQSVPETPAASAGK